MVRAPTSKLTNGTNIVHSDDAKEQAPVRKRARTREPSAALATPVKRTTRGATPASASGTPSRRRLPLNTLPTLKPPRDGSAQTVLCWGTGDFGDLGLGSNWAKPIHWPVVHPKLKSLYDSEELGKVGIRDIEGGGMYGVAIDDLGRVST